MWLLSPIKSGSSTWQDRWMSRLPVSWSRPEAYYPVIPNSTEESEWGMEKCGVLHFCSNILRSGGSYALHRCRSLIGNRINESNGHLQLQQVYEISFGTRRISSSVSRPTACMFRYLSICWASCSVKAVTYLHDHLLYTIDDADNDETDVDVTAAENTSGSPVASRRTTWIRRE